MDSSKLGYAPLLSQLRNYKKESLHKDLIAGLTVAVVLVPQAMAYALVAGLPPVYGLYAASIPLIVSAIFQATPQIAVGPVAITAFLTYSALITFVKPSDPAFIDYAIIMAFLVGIIRLIMGLFRLGFLLRFFSIQTHKILLRACLFIHLHTHSSGFDR